MEAARQKQEDEKEKKEEEEDGEGEKEGAGKGRINGDVCVSCLCCDWFYISSPLEEGKVLECGAMLQKEVPGQGLVDEECGDAVKDGHAGLCE